MAENNQNCLRILKTMRDKINCKVITTIREPIIYTVGDQCENFDELYSLIRKWQGPLPDFRDIFRSEQMDLFLSNIQESQFIKFVARTGYKDEPKLDKDGKPPVFRTTPVHHAVHHVLFNRHVVPDLFQIYDRFDVNYTDKSGLTHFHAACQFGCLEIVEKFLELGQDPNCIWHKTDDSPLHLALANKHKDVVELLLRSGANPHLANSRELAPVDIFSKTNCSLATLRKYSDKKQHRFEQFDGVDEWGQTSLHYALLHGKKGRTATLLRKGVNPNFPNADGSTPLHIICMSDWLRRFRYAELAEIFFEVNDEKHQTVHIDAVDKLGRTPLQWAVANLLTAVVVILLERGADLTKFVFPNETYFAVPYRRYGENDTGHIVQDLASEPLVIVECLKKKGFEIGLNDALIIIKFCHRIGTIRTLVELYCGKDDDNRHCEACKNDGESRVPSCDKHKSMVMSRRFFRLWGLEFLLMMTHYQLPILCCEKIMDMLSNDDVLMMCTASEVMLKQQNHTHDVHVDEFEKLKNLRLTEEC